MLAIAAAIVFAIFTFGGHLGTVNLVGLGLTLLALHLAFGGWLPIPWRRR